MNTKKAIIWVDGGSQGNPGPAAIGAVIKDENGVVHARVSRSIGETTNNEAEYRAVIAALEKAIKLGVREIHLNSDSELVVRQLTGDYRVRKASLRPLYERVKQLAGSLESFDVVYIPREINTEAHNLAARALH